MGGYFRHRQLLCNRIKNAKFALFEALNRLFKKLVIETNNFNIVETLLGGMPHPAVSFDSFPCILIFITNERFKSKEMNEKILASNSPNVWPDEASQCMEVVHLDY